MCARQGMRVPRWCMRGRAHILCAVRAAACASGCSFSCLTCRCFQRFTMDEEDEFSAGESGQYGFWTTFHIFFYVLSRRAKKAADTANTSASTMFARQALDANAFELSCHLYSKIASLACRPHIRSVLDRR